MDIRSACRRLIAVLLRLDVLIFDENLHLVYINVAKQLRLSSFFFSSAAHPSSLIIESLPWSKGGAEQSEAEGLACIRRFATPRTVPLSLFPVP